MAESEKELGLSEHEIEQAEKRTAIRAHVVHVAILREGEIELRRPSAALAWSGLAAGLSMGFSMVCEGLLRAGIPDTPWRPLISKLGYSVGFLLAIMGRQQLFTENTLTPILPLLLRRDRETLGNVLRLWAIVLATNLVGAALFAWVAAGSGAFQPDARRAFLDISRETASVGFGPAMLRGVFAGWLIALMVWMLPFAESARLWVIVLVTWVVGAARLTHIVAGSVEVLYAAAAGAVPLSQAVMGYMLPALIGNVLGGVALVAALNHAQVVAGE